MKKLFFIIASFLTFSLGAKPAEIPIENTNVQLKNYSQPVEQIKESQVKEITNLDQLKKEIESSDIPIFVECYSTYCPPCKVLSPIYETFSIKYASKAKFLKVNLLDAREISNAYSIRAIPTLLIFNKEGNLKDRKIGYPEIKDYLDSYKIQ